MSSIRRAADQKAVELTAPYEDLTKFYTKSLKFNVVHPRVVVRKTPSTKGALVKTLLQGTVVHGFLQGKWLKIAGGDGGWVLVDGSELGFGALLQPQEKMCELEMKGEFSNSAWVAWNKVPGRNVEYCIQWHLRSNPNEVHTTNQRETMCMTRVHDLPHEEEISLRVIADILTDTKEFGGQVLTTFEGEWVTYETGREVTDMDESNFCCDPLANIRGRCMDCNCGAFVLSNYGDNRPDQRLESIVCRRCSCSCVRHVIIGEFQYAKTGPRQDKTKQMKDETSKALAAAKALEMPEVVWRAEDAGDEDKVQFVLDKVAQARTLYETLGIATSADEKEIRSAYRHLSLVIHPDKVQTREDAELAQQAEGAFKIISSAHEVLSDEVKRIAYNRSVRIRPPTSISWSRSNLTSLSFIKRFLGKSGFGYDLKAKPPGDWEQQGVGMWRRSDKSHIIVTHAISGEKFTAHIDKGSTVGSLKKRMVTELKRGPASRIELLDSDGKEVKDTYMLHNSENFETAGIHLGPPKEVSLCLIHADSGARVRIKVLDTSSMEEIRAAAGQRLGRKSGGEQIRLGARSKNQDAFQSFEDADLLNGREQLLVLGVDISHTLDLEEATELQRDLLEAYGADCFQKELDALLEQNPMPDALANSIFRERFGEIVKAAQADTLVKYGFDGKHGVYTMLNAFSEVGNAPEVKSLLAEIDKKLRVTRGGWLPSVATVTLEQAFELTVEVVVDRALADWPTKLKVRKGLTILDLKRHLCRSDVSGQIQPDSFGLGMPVDDASESVGQRIADFAQLDDNHSKLEICDTAAPILPSVKAEKFEDCPRRLMLTLPNKKCRFREIRELAALKLKVDVEAVKIATASPDTLEFSYYKDEDDYNNQKVLQVLGADFPIVPVQELPQASTKTKPAKAGQPALETTPKELTPEKPVKESIASQDPVKNEYKCDNCHEMKTTGRAGDANSAYARAWYCSDCWRLWDQAGGQLDKFERHYVNTEKLDLVRSRKEKDAAATMPEKLLEPQKESRPGQGLPSRQEDDPEKMQTRNVAKKPSTEDESREIGPKLQHAQIKVSASTRAGEKCEILANTLDEDEDDEEVAFLLSRCVQVKFADGQCEWFKTEDVEEPEVSHLAPKEQTKESPPTQIKSTSETIEKKASPASIEVIPEAPSKPPKLAVEAELPKPTPPLATAKTAPEPPKKPMPHLATAKAAPEPPKQLSVNIRHIATGDVVSLSIMSSSSMMNLKRALARKVGRPAVLEFGKLVDDDNEGGYRSFANNEVLGTSRPQVLFMNATLKDKPDKEAIEEREYDDAENRGMGISLPPKQAEKKPDAQMLVVTIRSLEYGHQANVKVPVTATIADLKESLAEFVGRPEVLDGKLLRRNADGEGFTSIKEESEPVGGRTHFTIMNADIQPAKGSPLWKEERAKVSPAKAKAKAVAPVVVSEARDAELVLITITHATNSKEQPVEVTIMDNLLVSDLKSALAKKQKRPEIVAKGRFVQKKGMSSFSGIRDTEAIGSRRSFLFMGVDMKRQT